MSLRGRSGAFPERVSLAVRVVTALLPRSPGRGYGEAEVARNLYPTFSGVYPALTKRPPRGSATAEGMTEETTLSGYTE